MANLHLHVSCRGPRGVAIVPLTRSAKRRRFSMTDRLSRDEGPLATASSCGHTSPKRPARIRSRYGRIATSTILALNAPFLVLTSVPSKMRGLREGPGMADP